MFYESNGQPAEITPFPYAALDGEHEPPETDEQTFWRLQGEFFGEILRWLTVPKSMVGIGKRCATLALYLNPALIKQTSLREIGSVPGGASGAGLSKAMLELQSKFNLKPSYYQKLRCYNEMFSKSAKAAHEERKTKQVA